MVLHRTSISNPAVSQDCFLTRREKRLMNFPSGIRESRPVPVYRSSSGGAAQGLAGYTDYDPQVEFGVIVPFTPDLRYVTLVDSLTGDTLISVDLTGPISAFQKMYPDDPDMKSLPETAPAGTFPVPWEMAAILGIALIAISGAGYFALLRRPQPVQVLIVDDEPSLVESVFIAAFTKRIRPDSCTKWQRVHINPGNS